MFQKIIVPLTILIAGGMIAYAIFVTQSHPAVTPSGTPAAANSITVAPVSAVDHIRGNKNAKIVIINYSDTECPFCKVFHQTLTKIFAEYGADNRVAWVYRHFPLDIHKRSPKEAEATECAGEIGGPDMFWKYIDNVYATTTSNDTLDPTQLPVIADEIGIDKTAFNTCLSSGKYAAKVQESFNAALAAGGGATPYTVLVINGQNIPLVDSQSQSLGALPYASFRSLIEQFSK